MKYKDQELKIIAGDYFMYSEDFRCWINVDIAIKKAKQEVFYEFDKHYKDWETLDYTIYEDIKQKYLHPIIDKDSKASL